METANTKHRVLILGGGKIGSLITCLLVNSSDYVVHLVDQDLAHARRKLDGNQEHVHFAEFDAQHRDTLAEYIRSQEITTVISGLPYYCNPLVAEVAAEHSVNYFDLTEDVEVTRQVSELSRGKKEAFVPQCGLAPGFVSIAAQELMNRFEKVDSVKMRVGALPVNPHNALKYSLTWSTDGLINEYGNVCYGIEEGEITSLLPLEGYETITIDGLQYEAFNTSGGLGTLAETSAGKVNFMNYKTMRYPGHCEKIRLLMRDLKLNEDRDTLKRILEQSIPKTRQDVVVVYIAVSGWRKDDLFEENYVKKIYPATIAGIPWSAIQVTTAAGICAVVDIVLNDPAAYAGLVRQEQIPLQVFLANRFGQYYGATSHEHEHSRQHQSR